MSCECANQSETSVQYSKQNTLDFFGGDELAADVYLKKYALTNREGQIEEYLPTQMWRRLAKTAASVEKDKEFWENRFYEILEDWKGVPQGSIMFALGNPYQRSSASNCFVLPNGDSLDEIFNCARDMAITYSYRGGVGTDLSNLRPESALVSNAARTSTGAWSFMDFYSYVTRLIGQHGRRGALMLTISDRHPDLLKFVTAKIDRTKVTGANISIKISDDFMKAVKNDDEWILSFKTKHETIETKHKAREIWDTIIKTATETAEPGLIFWDQILRESPGNCYADEGFRETCTNPCITDDTWILTSNGAKQVKDIIGTQFTAIVNGKPYLSTKDGFYFTGHKPILEIKTNRGYNIKCTGNHLIKTATFKDRKQIFSWKRADEIRQEDILVMNNHRGYEWEGNGTFDEGFIVGSLLGDGTFSEKTAILYYWGETKESMYAIASAAVKSSVKCRSDCGSGTLNTRRSLNKDLIGLKSAGLKSLAESRGIYADKQITKITEQTSSDFYKGFLRGWFDADGTVLSAGKMRNALRLSSVNIDNLYCAQRMLARLGILSTVYANRSKAGPREMPDGKGGKKEYCCQSMNELHISKDNLNIFHNIIGFADQKKSQKLEFLISKYSKGPYPDNFTSVVTSIKSHGREPVYDCTIPEISEFDANGISVHNCSELPLPDYDACTLFSQNLTKYTRNIFTKKAYFDFHAFKRDTKDATRFLDNVKELDLDLMPLPKQKEVARKGRRIGMGTHGMADMLAHLCLKYDSQEAINFIDKLYKFYAQAVYEASAELAVEKGAFPIFDAKKEKDNPFLNRIGFAGIPRRNISCLTCAPTGSVACISQTSSGVEPVFRNFYTRRRKITHNEAVSVPKEKLHKDKMGDLWQEYDVAHHNVMNYIKTNNIGFDGNAQTVKLPDYFVQSNEIDWEKRVEIQATMGAYIDHSISATINLPNGTTTEIVKSIYMKAWESGCKGMTVYVDGCRDGVLITNKDESNKIQKTQAPKRPKDLDADVYHVAIKGQSYFVMVGLLNGEPYEVFAGKNGIFEKKAHKAIITKIRRGHYKAILDTGENIDNISDHITEEEAAITRLISLSLRHGADIKHCVDVMEKVPGDMHNFARCIARILKKYIPEGDKVTGSSCMGCGSENLTRSEGCKRCIDCGWTACN